MQALRKRPLDAIKARGAHPFIVPCMGSHGGATAEGQTEVLHAFWHYGRNDGRTDSFLDGSCSNRPACQWIAGLCGSYASEADAIVVINRVKPHTAFRGRIESGIMKMIAIGLGKQKGAEACHQLGFKYMAENVPAMANLMIEKLPIVFGVALVENAYDETCQVEVLPAAEIEAREEPLIRSKRNHVCRKFYLMKSMCLLLIISVKILAETAWIRT